MKKVSFLVAASFSLLSFSALAGDNCLYGQKHTLAKAAIEDAVIAQKVDPNLLALSKKYAAQNEQLKPVVTFN